MRNMARSDVDGETLFQSHFLPLPLSHVFLAVTLIYTLLNESDFILKLLIDLMMCTE